MFELCSLSRHGKEMLRFHLRSSLIEIPTFHSSDRVHLRAYVEETDKVTCPTMKYGLLLDFIEEFGQNSRHKNQTNHAMGADILNEDE